MDFRLEASLSSASMHTLYLRHSCFSLVSRWAGSCCQIACVLWTLEMHQESVLFVTLESSETAPCTWILIGCRSGLLIRVSFLLILNFWIVSCWACVTGEDVSPQLVFRSFGSCCYVQVGKCTQLLWTLFVPVYIFFLYALPKEGIGSQALHVLYSARSSVFL